MLDNRYSDLLCLNSYWDRKIQDMEEEIDLDFAGDFHLAGFGLVVVSYRHLELRNMLEDTERLKVFPQDLT
eukprot:CAMPEP_0202943752 /NCGR_PEP_ID=MMETSP1395-20130829/4302_1 /ASSEMBLY_ACC=CAM_ASM_000871 /TAXON_ID=5961 /ORGANISM="Blepharisma japonicum, Strain Stock R1072" /LENGTH=70 /DNA_ID=CAMNT_0049641619 /DNA_START=151 /DNA_END=359 /DNA_ORIENTATION=+